MSTGTRQDGWTSPLRWLDRSDALLAGRGARLSTLLLVLLAAGAMRWTYFRQLTRTFGFARPMVDALDYDEQARGILDGTWPRDEVFFVDPLYSWLLAAQYAVFGTDPVRVLVVQMVVGALGVGLLWLLAAAFLRPTEALLAGLLAATYGVYLFFEGLLLKESFAVFGLTALLLALVRARRGALVWSLGAGLLLGACGLLRGNLLALGPVLFAWLWWASDEEAFGRLRRPLLLALGAVLAVLPVSAHNLRAGDWVLTTSNAGANLYTGNGPHNDTGTYVPPEGVRASPVFEQQDFERIAEEAEGRELRPSEVSRWWTARTIAEARADPRRTVELLGRKALLFLNAVEVPDNESYALTREDVALLRAPLPCYGLLLVLATAAVVLMRWRPEHALVSCVFLTVGLTVVVFFVNARFRLSAVPPLLLLAASLPGGVAEGLARGAWVRGALAALLAACALFVTTLDVYRVSATMLHYNDAVIALDEGDDALALAFLEEALAEDEANWRALVMRGRIRADQGREDEAEASLLLATRAAHGQADKAEALRELAAFHSDRNRHAPALAALERALDLDPESEPTILDLADVERRLRRRDDARTRLTVLLARKPHQARALHLLGLVEREDRNWSAAEAALRRAIEARPESLRFRLDLARTLDLAGKDAEAAATYDEVLAIDPENEEARQGRRATGVGRDS